MRHYIGISAALVLAIACSIQFPACSQSNQQPVAQATQETASRALPSPIDSPPFPSGDWLGYPVIGEPDSVPDYPLQKALFGKSLDASRIKVYGWADVSYNCSTSKNSNYPVSYSIAPNRIELDQLALRIERQPDTVQTDHQDWGFRISTIYGIDYRFTTMKGVFSDQLLEHNNLYGVDPMEVYGIWYYPKVAQGMELRVGRYISPPDIEAQTAPDNYLFTHSVMFTVDPYTFMGVNAVIRFDPYWELMLGVHAGNDMAVWSNSAEPNGEIMLRWVSKSNNDSIWGGLNSIGSGECKNGHDNLQQAVATWGHKFNNKWHMMTEGYYMWQRNGPLGGSFNDGPVESFGGGGGPGTIIPGFSDETGVVNYLQYEVGPKDYLSFRTDYLNDPYGQRYGFPGTWFTSFTLGYIHHFTDLLMVRPEIRYDHAYNSTPYDNGTRADQFMISGDIVQRF
jgi:hypothetical protein